MNDVGRQTTNEQTAVRPFHVSIPDAELADMRKRIKATRWPERETVTDESQGVKLSMMQDLARYWATDYDWRKVESRLNALQQFITEIDGWTCTSFTLDRCMKMHCPSSSRTDGPARSSITSRLSTR